VSRPARARCSATATRRRVSMARRSNDSSARASALISPVPTLSRASGYGANAVGRTRASSCVPRSSCSPAMGVERSPRGPSASSWPQASMSANAASRPGMSSPLRRPRSRGRQHEGRAPPRESMRRRCGPRIFSAARTPARLGTHWAYNLRHAHRSQPRTIELAGTSAAGTGSWREDEHLDHAQTVDGHESA
jgi:hypothetical protein